MNIGMLGLGKLGLPVALAIESKGHTVKGSDINPDVKKFLKERKIPFKERGIQPLLDRTKLEVVDTTELVASSDIVFCAIQTPHDPKFEGTTKLPKERSDFDYTHLKLAVADIAHQAKKVQKKTTLVVISTCLPGTFEREIKPLLNEYIEYVYNPFFIAMGQVVDDFLHPEFVLIGQRDEVAAENLQSFYRTLHSAECVVTDITTAEGIKVSYNTWITAKTVIANVWGELCHKLGMNFDDMFKAWSLSTDRLISTKYMKSGVGDGGGCHPRDNIAMSHLASKVSLSRNIFEDLMKARENHMAWIGREATRYSLRKDLPIVMLGRSFKPETNIETGSPAILLHNLLANSKEYPHPIQHFDTIHDLRKNRADIPAVYIIATQHSEFARYKFPEGSVIVDPFRYIPKQNDVQCIQIGSKVID